MKHNARVLLCSIFLLAILSHRAHAYPPNNWELYAGPVGGGGLAIGVLPESGTADGYSPMDARPDVSAAFAAEYMQSGNGFPGDTGLYIAAYRTPISPGGAKTWSDIYLWAQNYTPSTAYRIPFLISTGDYFQRPTGYIGHLVLDYVPPECSWGGPMDYWLNLGVDNTLTLPIATTPDPLQGVRMSLTVYAPDVPEPSSLLLLGSGLLFLAARRRRA